MRFRVLGLAILVASLSAPALGTVSFDEDIQPILRQHCLACHGGVLQQSGLRLDLRDEALRGGASGIVIIPGDAAGSALVHRLEGRAGLQRMPPAAPLRADQIAALRAWIDAGAPWGSAVAAGNDAQAGHWAFRRHKHPPLPSVRQAEWIRNPIDAFVLASLEAEGLEASPEAEPHTLLRRIHLDLVGLPPEASQVGRSVDYDEVVDRLLQSEHFGERWAAVWLDQVRYADSDGYEKDTVRPNAWRYRHWVIDALNRNVPFDRFTVEQLAGDQISGAGPEQKVGTGFYRNTLKNREGGVNVEEFRFEEVADRTNTVASVWLGLTLECARCHDHKYDPITQRDYYRMFAFFNELDEVDIDAPLPGEMGSYLRSKPAFDQGLRALYAKYKVRELQAPWTEKLLWAAENPGLAPAWDVTWDTLATYIDDGQRILRTPPAERDWREDYVLTEWFLRNYSRVTTDEEYDSTGFREAAKEVQRLVSRFADVSRARAVQADASPPRTYIHPAGTWDEFGEEVSPGTPPALPLLKPSGRTATRLDLARWIVSRDNPLTARVTVNRIWQEYFGTGLVSTSDNFGLRGEQPSHPELLDWLAAEFVDSGWNLKHIHRLIATSATYRQSSRLREDLAQRDPANRLLARQARLRLPAETLRDASLAVSGLLDPKVGGPSVRPYQPEGVTELGYANSVQWPVSLGGDRYRRGVYIHFQRTTPYPFLANFDLQERNVAQCQRGRSNTPLQALNLLNDPVFFEMAQGLAYRVLTELPGRAFAERLGHAFNICLGREPRRSEREALLDYYLRQRTLLEEAPEAAGAWFPVALEGPGGTLDRTESAAWVGVSRILLNLDEFITRE